MFDDKIKLYKSNNRNTNLFETTTGVFDRHPINLCGRWRLVVSSCETGYKLSFDDFNNRRIEIDENKPFIPQLCNFLSVDSTDDVAEKTYYGGYRDVNKWLYQMTLNLGYETVYPDYAVFTLKTRMNDWKNDKDFEYLDVIDLNKIGVIDILKQMRKESELAVFSDSDIDSYQDGINAVMLNGIDIKSQTPSIKYVSVDKLIYDINTFNSRIHQAYTDNDIIFPGIITIAFELERKQSRDFEFAAISGYLTNETSIPTESDFNVYTRKLNDNKLVFHKGGTAQSYFSDIGIFVVQDINEQDYLYRLKFDRNYVSGTIRIEYFGNRVYEYVTDKDNIYDISRDVVIKTGYLVHITIDNDTLRIKSPAPFTVTTYGNLQHPDYEYNGFKATNIDTRDTTVLNGNILNVDITGYILVHEYFDDNTKSMVKKNYNILEKFCYDGLDIIRLDDVLPIRHSTKVEVIKKMREKRIYLKKIPFLYQNFGSISFKGNNYKLLTDQDTNVPENEKYVENGESTSDIKIIGTDEMIQCMSSGGSTSFCDADLLNFDERFRNELSSRFNWFLIKDKMPKYVADEETYRQLRYFEDEPKLTSLLKRVSADKCSCHFLGITYLLPAEYTGYRFAVYADVKTKTPRNKFGYKTKINHIQKTFYIVIDRYFSGIYKDSQGTEQKDLDTSMFDNDSEKDMNVISNMINYTFNIDIEVDKLLWRKIIVTTPYQVDLKSGECTTYIIGEGKKYFEVKFTGLKEHENTPGKYECDNIQVLMFPDEKALYHDKDTGELKEISVYDLKFTYGLDRFDPNINLKSYGCLLDTNGDSDKHFSEILNNAYIRKIEYNGHNISDTIGHLWDNKREGWCTFPLSLPTDTGTEQYDDNLFCYHGTDAALNSHDCFTKEPNSFLTIKQGKYREAATMNFIQEYFKFSQIDDITYKLETFNEALRYNREVSDEYLRLYLNNNVHPDPANPQYDIVSEHPHIMKPGTTSITKLEYSRRGYITDLYHYNPLWKYIIDTAKTDGLTTNISFAEQQNENKNWSVDVIQSMEYIDNIPIKAMTPQLVDGTEIERYSIMNLPYGVLVPEGDFTRIEEGLFDGEKKLSPYWKEILGTVKSTIYNGEKEYNVHFITDQTKFNIIDALYNDIDSGQVFINNKTQNNLPAGTDIKKLFSQWLITHIYQVSEVYVNESRVKHTIDEYNNIEMDIPESSTNRDIRVKLIIK